MAIVIYVSNPSKNFGLQKLNSSCHPKCLKFNDFIVISQVIIWNLRQQVHQRKISLNREENRLFQTVF